MKDLQELVRPNILALKPYSSARDEYKGIEASVFLDANENPYNNPNNRYPDPLHRLKEYVRNRSSWVTEAMKALTWSTASSAGREQTM